MFDASLRKTLDRGVAIPAHPLALTANRKLDERRQRALSRYYIAAGVGGLAVGVHTTQFAIHDPKVGLLEPVLRLAQEEMDRADDMRGEKLIRVGGVIGRTDHAVREAGLLRALGYHAGLLNLSAMQGSSVEQLVAHARAVADVIPLFGFYLSPAVGGIRLPFAFWQKFVEIENLVAIKIAAFNRYQTLDVIRALAEAGRDDIALYTGNDDNIVFDLLTPHRFASRQGPTTRRIAGGLLGHWAVWTQKGCEQLETCHRQAAEDAVSAEMLRLAIEVTDCNAAFFDAANDFRGCVPGLHEVLRRQGLLEGIWCLNPSETLGPGQLAEIDRVYAAYPHLNDDAFVQENRDAWLS